MSMIIQPARFSSGPPIVGTTLYSAGALGPGAANVAFSNGDLTVTKSASNSVTHVRAKHGKITGKWRFQMTVNVLPMAGGEIGVGVSGPFAITSSYLGADTHGVDFINDGRWGTAGGFGASGLGVWAAGDVIDVYVDADAKKVWFGRNGTVSGNPTAGTGGFNMSGLIPAFYPEAYMHGGNGQETLNFAGPFTHNLHPAFLPWSASRVVSKTNARGVGLYIRSVGYFAHCIGELKASAASGGANLLLGGTASAQGSSSGNVPGRAIDGNDATWWEYTVNGGSNQNPAWFYADSGVAGQTFNYLAVQARAGSGGEQLQAPTLFDLYLSADGVSYETQMLNIALAAFPPQTPGLIREIAIADFV